MSAPFGRRLCEVAENKVSGGYRIFSLRDREGPTPEPAAEQPAEPTPSVDVNLVKPREPGTLPPKRPRALDEDNPFAG